MGTKPRSILIELSELGETNADFEVGDNGDGSIHVNFETAWDFPFPIFQKLVAEFPTLTFEGSAQEPNMEMFIRFEGRNDELTYDDDEDARAEAAAAYAEEDEGPKVTA